MKLVNMVDSIVMVEIFKNMLTTSAVMAIAKALDDYFYRKRSDFLILLKLSRISKADK